MTSGVLDPEARPVIEHERAAIGRFDARQWLGTPRITRGRGSVSTDGGATLDVTLGNSVDGTVTFKDGTAIAFSATPTTGAQGLYSVEFLPGRPVARGPEPVATIPPYRYVGHRRRPLTEA